MISGDAGRFVIPSACYNGDNTHHFSSLGFFIVPIDDITVLLAPVADETTVGGMMVVLTSDIRGHWAFCNSFSLLQW